VFHYAKKREQIRLCHTPTRRAYGARQDPLVGRRWSKTSAHHHAFELSLTTK